MGLICKNMIGTRVYYAKRNQSVRERQISYDLTHIWNLRYKTDELKEGKKNKIKTGRETNHKRLKYRE